MRSDRVCLLFLCIFAPVCVGTQGSVAGLGTSGAAVNLGGTLGASGLGSTLSGAASSSSSSVPPHHQHVRSKTAPLGGVSLDRPSPAAGTTATALFDTADRNIVR